MELKDPCPKWLPPVTDSLRLADCSRAQPLPTWAFPRGCLRVCTRWHQASFRARDPQQSRAEGTVTFATWPGSHTSSFPHTLLGTQGQHGRGLLRL